jgi:cardiolipin synthase C
MNRKFFISGTAVCALALAACVSKPKFADRTVASSSSLQDILRQGSTDNSMNFADQSPPRLLGENDIARMASVANLNLAEARVIKDNDAAFQSKLDMINSAKRSIRMIYFIYADDDSSSVLSNALIEKAKDGVKVSLLVDFITNYSRLDYFRMMEIQGKGNLSVHYYNFPSATILEDAKYMTLPCPPKTDKVAPDACAKFKKPLMDNMVTTETNGFSRLFLAGLYGKNATALKIAMGYGAQINPDDYKSEKEVTAEDKAHLFDFFKLMKDAAGGDLAAKLKLSVAMSTYGETLNPIMNETTGRFPVMSSDSASENRSSVWDHLTDYTHHKLLIVDGEQFQLGGRNVEDSYHMKSRIAIEGRPAKGKYIFIDTDFWGRAKNAGDLKGIEDTFDKLLGAAGMVANTARVTKVIPNEFILNSTRAQADKPSPGEMAVGTCLEMAKAGKTKDIGGCIEMTLPSMPGYVTQESRVAAAYPELKTSADIYLKNYRQSFKDNMKNAPWADGVDQLSAKDMQEARISYIENVGYDRKNPAVRNKGARIGGEAAFNKNIHALWYRGLENVCKVSRDTKTEKRVVFHSAYLFMPTGLTHKIAKMLNGDYGDCSRVRVTFLTNSFETTDLNVINIFARYQMRELFHRYKILTDYADAFDKSMKRVGAYKRFFPRIEYYDYKSSAVGSGYSLHTKASILGDDIIIGSANADVRSYYMDTNNGVFIRNASDLVRDYVAYIDNLIGDSNLTTNRGVKLASVSDEEIAFENKIILACMAEKWDKKGKITTLESRSGPGSCMQGQNVLTARGNRILSEVNDIGARITSDTTTLLDFRREFDAKGGSALELKMNKLANDFDNYFKTL